MLPPPPRPTLFPYTTLFRSVSTETRHDGAPDQIRPRHVLAGREHGPEALDHEAVLDAANGRDGKRRDGRSEEHTSELQSQFHLVCRLLLEKKKTTKKHHNKI